MPYPSSEEALAAAPVTEWIDRHVLRVDPVAFPDADAFLEFRMAVVRELNVEMNSVFCIGSAASGLSFNPGKVEGGTLKAWDDESDVDIAVISSRHFNQAWMDIRLIAQPWADHEMSGLINEHLNWQRKRLMDGAILAHAILPALSFGPQWMASIARLNQLYAEQTDTNRDLHVWIYKDYWSVRNYVAKSLDRCQRILQ